MPRLFPKPLPTRASAALNEILARKSIVLETNFNTSEVGGKTSFVLMTNGKCPMTCCDRTDPHGRGFYRSFRMGDAAICADQQIHLAVQPMGEHLVMGDANNIRLPKRGPSSIFKWTSWQKTCWRIWPQGNAGKFDGHSLCYIESGFNKPF